MTKSIQTWLLVFEFNFALNEMPIENHVYDTKNRINISYFTLLIFGQ